MKDVMQVVRSILEDQKCGVIGSNRRNSPYLNLVAFACAGDLRTLLFVTSKSTRKYENICNDSNVSMLIDSRGNSPKDFRDAMAVTAFGNANVTEDPGHRTLFLQKHPYLQEFVESPTTVIFRLDVSSYTVVANFQHVTEVNFDE